MNKLPLQESINNRSRAVFRKGRGRTEHLTDHWDRRLIGKAPRIYGEIEGSNLSRVHFYKSRQVLKVMKRIKPLQGTRSWGGHPQHLLLFRSLLKLLCNPLWMRVIETAPLL